MDQKTKIVLLVMGVVLLLSSIPLKAADWRLEDHVVECVLENGFTILVVERHDTPLIYCNLYYGVGSVREHSGITGISHL